MTVRGLWLAVMLQAVASAVCAAAPADAPAATAVAKMSDDELIRQLARARRIDPDGLQLLRVQAYLRRSIEWHRLRIAMLESDSEVHGAAELVAKPTVQQQLRELQKLPPDEVEARYRELLKQWSVSDLAMDMASERQAALRQLAKLEQEIADVKQQLSEHEEGGSLSLWALRAAFDRQGGISSSRPLAAIKPKREELTESQRRRVADILHILVEGDRP